MAIELHHLHPSHDDEMTHLKARIAELEKEVERLQRYHDAEATKWLAENQKLKEERRWRKVDEDFPTDDEGYFFVMWEDDMLDVGYIGAEDDVIETIRDRGEGHSVEYWMPMPEKPKDNKFKEAK